MTTPLGDPDARLDIPCFAFATVALQFRDTGSGAATFGHGATGIATTGGRMTVN